MIINPSLLLINETLGKICEKWIFQKPLFELMKGANNHTWVFHCSVCDSQIERVILEKYIKDMLILGHCKQCNIMYWHCFRFTWLTELNDYDQLRTILGVLDNQYSSSQGVTINYESGNADFNEKGELV
jgi:hypothetical protein